MLTRSKGMTNHEILLNILGATDTEDEDDVALRQMLVVALRRTNIDLAMLIDGASRAVE